MALTTKFFTAAVTASCSLSYAYSRSGTASNFTGFVSSSYNFSASGSNISTASTIYTVPAGRTAKVIVNPRVLLSVSFSILDRVSYAKTSSLVRANQSLFPTPIVSDLFNFDSYFSSDLRPSIITNATIGAQIVGPLSSVAAAISSFSYGSNYLTALNLTSELFNGPLYFFMGPEKPLNVIIRNPIISFSVIYGLSQAGVSVANFSWSNSGSISALFTSTIEFMVIEESAT